MKGSIVTNTMSFYCSVYTFQKCQTEIDVLDKQAPGLKSKHLFPHMHKLKSWYLTYSDSCPSTVQTLVTRICWYVHRCNVCDSNYTWYSYILDLLNLLSQQQPPSSVRQQLRLLQAVTGGYICRGTGSLSAPPHLITIFDNVPFCTFF